MVVSAAFGPTGFWVLGAYPLLRVLPLAVSLLQRVTFSKRRKVTQKALPRRTARSLGLGVPSLRDRSGRSVSGLLRCTSSRCVRLRRTVAALPPRIDPVTKPAEGAKDQEPKQSKSQIKSQIKRSQPSAAPTVGSREFDRNWLPRRSPSRAGSLLQGGGVHQEKSGRLSGRLRELAPTEQQSSAAARGEAAPLNNER
ncbi:hypothetical protein ABIA54_000705 [Pseudomonas sp. EB276 TE3739]|nr:hypothetical protein [Pseudomonas koreensis]